MSIAPGGRFLKSGCYKEVPTKSKAGPDRSSPARSQVKGLTRVGTRRQATFCCFKANFKAPMARTTFALAAS